MYQSFYVSELTYLTHGMQKCATRPKIWSERTGFAAT